MDYRGNTLHIGDLSALDLISRFGSPLYVYDAASIRTQIANVKRAFGRLPLRPCFAMKANSNLALLRMIREEGFGCDAVSPGEIHLALHAGFAPDDIWFTCSNVSDGDLQEIRDPRIVINVNSPSEIERCLRLGLTNPIALRVNPDIGAGHHRDVTTAGEGVKFGIDTDQLESARKLVEDSGRKVVGLHSHIGSGIDTPAPLLEAARRMLELSASFSHLNWINFGGGFGTPYRPTDEEFPLDEYGAALTGFADAPLRARGLTAIIEPGRYIVAQGGTLLTTVTSHRVSYGHEWLGTDTGFNHLVRPSKYGAYHHIVNATNGTAASLRTSYDASKMTMEAVIAGNLCESSDVFTRGRDGAPVGRPMEPTVIGDVLAICDAGAYGFSMGSHYNARLFPAEVLVDGGEARLIRQRQSYDDLLRGM